MPMNTAWSSLPRAAEVQRLVEDLVGAEVAGERASARSRRSCRSAGSPTARRGRASGARRGSASAPPRPRCPCAVRSSALTVPSRGARLALERRACESGTCCSSVGAQRPPAGRSSARRRRRRARATPRPGARGRAARRGVRSVSRSRSAIHRPMVAAVRLAKFLAHCRARLAARRRRDRPRRARPRRRRRELDPAREIDGERVELDGRPVAGVEARVVYALNKPAGVVSTVRDTHGRPTVVELVSDDAAPLPGRPAGRRQHRADPADQRRRAGEPAHAPALRGAEDLPRAPRAARAPGARGARARCATASSSTTGGPRPATVRAACPAT